MYGRLSRGISIRKGLSQTGSAGGTVLNGRITSRPVQASPEAQLRRLALPDRDSQLAPLARRRRRWGRGAPGGGAGRERGAGRQGRGPARLRGRPGAAGPARPLRADAGAAWGGRGGRAARRPVRGVSSLPEHGGPQQHQGRRPGRGAALRGVPQDPGPDPRVGTVTRKLVVEADGGSRGNPGPAGYGALVRDQVTGQVLEEISDRLGTATNNAAEDAGLVAGLRAAARIAPQADVEGRMDSKLVGEQMSGRWQIKDQNLRSLCRPAQG